MLVVRNDDVPGHDRRGHRASLGDAGINIADMDVGRSTDGRGRHAWSLATDVAGAGDDVAGARSAPSRGIVVRARRWRLTRATLASRSALGGAEAVGLGGSAASA